MAKVGFTIPGDLPNALAAQVPVDIFDSQLLKKAAGHAGGEIELSPGIYGARAMLPDGRELEAAFRVGEGEDPVQLQMSFVGASAPVRFDLKSTADPPGATESSPAADIHVRILTGNPFLNAQRTGDWQAVRLDAPFSVQGGVALRAIEVRNPEPSDTRQFMLPVQPDEQRRVEFRLDDKGRAWPLVIFEDPELELLVQYLGAGMVGSAAGVARSGDGLAARALREARRPMGATLGAYLLLQAAGPREAAEFSVELPRRFPWLPDAWVLHAEVLARQGRHQDALSALMSLREVGPPLFSSGLSYAVNRMRQYMLRVAKGALHVDAHRFMDFASQLDWLAERTDFDRPILTYRPPAAPPVD